MCKRQFAEIVLPVAAFVPLLVAGLMLTSPHGLARSVEASFDPRSI